METVRELTYSGPVSGRPAQQKVTPVLAKGKPAPATDAELRAAFIGLLMAVTPSEQKTIVAEIRGQRPQSKPDYRVLVDTPEARAEARRSFGF